MATSTEHHDAKIAAMQFASVYPHYVAKVIKKGRTETELRTVISWLTGYTDEAIAQAISEKINFETFFNQAQLHPNAHLI